jgi:hypothetical protein
MNARILIAVACVAMLSACSGGKFVVNERYFPSGVVFVPDERKVNVSIDDRDGVSPPVILVNREPVKLNANPGEMVTVTFRMQNQGHQSYTFGPLQMSGDPLVWGELKGSPKFGETSCSFGSDRTELNCTFKVERRRQANSYVLRVCDAKGANCFQSDPSMMN